MRNSDFEKRFARNRKWARIFFFFNLTLITTVIVGVVFLSYKILINPEVVGEFFGKIVKGFDSVH